MKKLHKGVTTNITNDKSIAGVPTLLCSNEGSSGAPAKDFLDTSADSVSEDMILEYLAHIITDICLSEAYEDYN